MDWIEIPIPTAIASGPVPQVIHYLKVDERWSVYIIEVEAPEDYPEAVMGPMGPMQMGIIQGRSKWFIIFDGSEVAQGVLKNIKTAKNVSMTVLNSLMEGPEPETVDGGPNCIIGKGSGN